MRVQPGQGEAGEDDPAPGTRRTACRTQRRGPRDPAGGEDAVADEEAAADEPDTGQRGGPGHHQGADPSDPEGDEQRVGQGAEAHHGEDGVPPDALAQHEGVLRADGHDEGEAGAESGGRCGEGVCHAADARKPITGSTAKDSYVT